MKLSQTPTDHILLKATCQSEWDNCNFAIITGGAEWAKWIQDRLNAAKAVQSIDNFLSLKFLDYSVGFYVSSEDEAEELLAAAGDGKDWAFVELTEDEEDEFVTPENHLDYFALSIYNNGGGKYTAYGKHTGEEFYTETIPLGEIVALYADQ